MAPQRPPQRLYLVTPLVADTAAFARELEAALAAADIAAVLLRLAEAGERALINRAKAIAAVVQRRDVALLIADKAEIAARAGADGAHLSGIERLTAALAWLKPDRIAGSGGLRSRHDAMLAAEAGADYVMFGEPLPPPFPPPQAGEGQGGGPRAGEGKSGGNGGGRRLSFEELQERLTWWAELFQIPCIGYAASLDEVGPLAQTGADFIALGEWIWTQASGVTRAIAAAAEHLAAPVP